MRLVGEWRFSGLFESGENADIGLAVTLALGACAIIVEEGFDALGEVGGLFVVDMDDERRALRVAVVDDQRELVEVFGLTVVAEVLGDEVGEIGE